MNMYQAIENGTGQWMTAFRVPGTDTLVSDSLHDTKAEARDRARFLNGTYRRGLVYQWTGKGVWTVGWYDDHGQWQGDGAHASPQAAARETAQRNGTDIWKYPQYAGPVQVIGEMIT